MIPAAIHININFFFLIGCFICIPLLSAPSKNYAISNLEVTTSVTRRNIYFRHQFIFGITLFPCGTFLLK